MILRSELELYNNEVVESIVECFWSNHVSKPFVTTFMSFCFTYCVFLIWCVRIQKEMNSVKEENFFGFRNYFDDTEVNNTTRFGESKFYHPDFYLLKSTFSAYFTAVCDLRLIFAGFLFLNIEFKQFRKSGPLSYFSEGCGTERPKREFHHLFSL